MWAEKCLKAAEASIRVLWLAQMAEETEKAHVLTYAGLHTLLVLWKRYQFSIAGLNSQQRPRMGRNNQNCNISKGGKAIAISAAERVVQVYLSHLKYGPMRSKVVWRRQC